MPNWKKVIVSGSNAVLNNITASGAISASGELYAGLSAWAGSDNSVVVYNDATGELMYTGSYFSGQTDLIIKVDGTTVVPSATSIDFLNASVTQGPTGEANVGFDLQNVTDSGAVTTNGSFFLHQQNASYGLDSNQLAKSGFDIDSGNAYSYVTPQANNYNAYFLTMPETNNGVGPHPYNYVTMNKALRYIGSNGPITTGGGGDDPTDPDNDHDSDLGGLLVVGGKGINLIASNSLESPDNDRYRGLGIYPSALYFFNKEASGSVSGGLQPASASAKIKFDTGSNAVKFFAGSTDEELKEVMHISKSGDNPRIGIGVSNPLKAFDFKDVSNTNRGAEILIRGSRIAKGAEVGDEAGRINFVIDSSSYAKVETSGSVAEVVAVVDEIDETGVLGSLSFRVSAQKDGDSIEKLRITSNGTKVTGSFTVSGSNSFINIGPAEFSGSVAITSSLEVDGAVTHNSTTTHYNNVLINTGRLDVNSTSGAAIRGSAGLSVGDLVIPGAGRLRVTDYSTLLGGVHIGGTTDPGTDNLLVDGTTTLVGDTIISGSDLFFPNLTAGATGNYDKLLIVDSTGQTRTLAKSSVPYIEVFDGVTPTNQTLVMFSGSTGDIANATGVTYNSGFGWTFSGVGSVYDITADDIFVTNDLTAGGDISAANGSFSGDLTVDGNITANQYIVSSSVTYMTQSFSSGSTIFGDTPDDTHQFTGSLYITGAVNIDGNLSLTNITASGDISASGNVEVNGNISVTGTVDGVDVATLKSDFDTLEGKTLVSGSSQIDLGSATGTAANASTASYVAGSNVDGVVASATISTTAINATNAANVDINNVSGNTEYGLIFRDGNGDGNQALYADNEVDQPSYNPSTNTIKTPIISASSALYVSGNITVEEGDITSNTFETISTTLASDSATNVDTFVSSAYNGAIYDYILKDTGVGARAGQFMVAHDSGLITFTDNSTRHLSDATAPEISAQINGANVEVQVTNGNGYTFKSFVKKL